MTTIKTLVITVSLLLAVFALYCAVMIWGEWAIIGLLILLCIAVASWITESTEKPK